MQECASIPRAEAFHAQHGEKELLYIAFTPKLAGDEEDRQSCEPCSLRWSILMLFILSQRQMQSPT